MRLRHEEESPTGPLIRRPTRVNRARAAARAASRAPCEPW